MRYRRCKRLQFFGRHRSRMSSIHFSKLKLCRRVVTKQTKNESNLIESLNAENFHGRCDACGCYRSAINKDKRNGIEARRNDRTAKETYNSSDLSVSCSLYTARSRLPTRGRMGKKIAVSVIQETTEGTDVCTIVLNNASSSRLYVVSTRDYTTRHTHDLFSLQRSTNADL